MLESNAIQISCLVNPFALEDHSSAVVGLQEKLTVLDGINYPLLRLEGLAAGSEERGKAPGSISS
jgi:hypothetical protein